MCPIRARRPPDAVRDRAPDGGDPRARAPATRSDRARPGAHRPGGGPLLRVERGVEREDGLGGFRVLRVRGVEEPLPLVDRLAAGRRGRGRALAPRPRRGRRTGRHGPTLGLRHTRPTDHTSACRGAPSPEEAPRCSERPGTGVRRTAGSLTGRRRVTDYGEPWTTSRAVLRCAQHLPEDRHVKILRQGLALARPRGRTRGGVAVSARPTRPRRATHVVQTVRTASGLRVGATTAPPAGSASSAPTAPAATCCRAPRPTARRSPWPRPTSLRRRLRPGVRCTARRAGARDVTRDEHGHDRHLTQEYDGVPVFAAS